MKLKQILLVAMVWALAVNVSQAVYKNIVVDGSFADWADVPVAMTDPSGDGGSGPDLATLKIANDETNIYLYISYHTAINPNAGPSVLLAFDTDMDVGTGFDVFGLGAVGSEAGWQNDFPFAQESFVFNSGVINGGAAQISPFNNVTTEQEYAIPLSAVYDSSGDPVFTGDEFRLLVYTDPTSVSEHMDPVEYKLAKLVEEPEFSEVALKSVVALQVTNSQEGVLYSLEYNTAFPSTNWTSSGFTIEGNGGTLYLFDPNNYSTAKVYRVLSWQK